MNKNKMFGLFALAIVGILVSTMVVSAYRGDYTKTGPDYSEERHEIMEAALESEDYGTWVDLMSDSGRDSRVLEVVTAENFHRFVEAHNLAESGLFEEANQIRAELGLNNGMGPRDGSGREAGMKSGMNPEGKRGGEMSGQGRGMRNSGPRDGSCLD